MYILCVLLCSTVVLCNSHIRAQICINTNAPRKTNNSVLQNLAKKKSIVIVTLKLVTWQTILAPFHQTTLAKPAHNFIFSLSFDKMNFERSFKEKCTIEYRQLSPSCTLIMTFLFVCTSVVGF